MSSNIKNIYEVSSLLSNFLLVILHYNLICFKKKLKGEAKEYKEDQEVSSIESLEISMEYDEGREESEKEEGNDKEETIEDEDEEEERNRRGGLG